MALRCPSSTFISSSARRATLVVALLAIAAMAQFGAAAADESRPNVVVIYTDDVGYGDVGCYGATRVRTPHIDKLSSQGLRFTDAHAAAATCTPSRYALLTGEYAWRKKGTNILSGSAAMIIEPGRLTLPALFQQAGYATGCVGKWHLGLGDGKIDWNGQIKPGPLEVGFDYAFLIPATGDRVPCVYVENHRVVGLDPNDPIQVSYGKPVGDEPTGREHPELLKTKFSHGHDQTIINGISRIGYMSGGKAARWVDEDMADVITHKATAFIEQSRDKPFFLYFSTHDIHVPRAPHSRFAGKSGCGSRGDVIEQLDWCVGQVLETLDRLKLADNTLVIFTSDNGPVVDDGYADGSVKNLNGHKPAGPLRGGKYSRYEGGTREPFIVRWPGRVAPGVSDALLSQVDLLSSFAALLDRKLPTEAGPDSHNVLPALLGQSKTGRETLVEQARSLALREGPWKYLEPAARRGGKGRAKSTPSQRARSAGNELYNLNDDLAETKNVADKHPDVARRMQQKLNDIRKQGRSRPTP